MPWHLENQAEASWGQAKIGGKVYFVPCNMANVSADAILIRGDLREKYGMDRLENLDNLEEYYTAVANDPDSGVSFAYDASQNNDRNKAIFLQAKNDWVRLEGALVNYISYKYSEDFTADDLLWMYGTQEYLDFAKQMKNGRTKDSGPRVQLQTQRMSRKPLLTEQVHLSHRTLEPWVQRHPRWSRTIRNGSLRYVI